MPATVLTRQQLNRATLSRQLLLKRAIASPLEAIGRLVGLQAQEARPPYVGLWTRLEAFQREDLTRLLHDRKAVRATAMRATIHLMKAEDYLAFRNTLQPMLSSGMQAILRKRAEAFDIAGAIEIARDFFTNAPATFDDLRKHFLANDPHCDERAMAYAVRTHLPLVQVPSDASWGFPAAASFTCADSWLGAPIGDSEKMDELILRYLAAFGPASATDAQTWLGTGGLSQVFNRLRENLVVYTDERGRELFDVPTDLPDLDTPAPVRFLPEYDNLLLAHSDRSRVIADAYRGRVVTANLRVLATFLVDGFVAGTWKVERKKAKAILILQPFEPLTKHDQEALAEEGERLVNFVEADAESSEILFDSRPGETA